jgi:phospholipase/carboxylesterase
VFGRPVAGKAVGLLVLLHGLGADGNDLIGLAPYFAEMVPQITVAAPDGPEPCDMSPFGRQWFSLQSREADDMLAGAVRARADVDAFIDEQLDLLGLDDDRLILGGFSQGAMTALHTGLRRARPPRCILSYSGLLVAGDQLAGEITSRPPVLIVHGEDDDVVPVSCAHDAETALGAAGVAVEAHVLPGLGHGIDQRVLALTGKFLARVWPR